MVLAEDPLTNRLFEENGVLYFWCRCRRRVLADMMLDLENPDVSELDRVPTSIRAARAARHPPGEDSRRFICDGCWTLWVRKGYVDKNVFRVAVGAPPLPPGSRSPW